MKCELFEEAAEMRWRADVGHIHSKAMHVGKSGSEVLFYLWVEDLAKESSRFADKVVEIIEEDRVRVNDIISRLQKGEIVSNTDRLFLERFQNTTDIDRYYR